MRLQFTIRIYAFHHMDPQPRAAAPGRAGGFVDLDKHVHEFAAVLRSQAIGIID
jgi:hypothetical protein